MGQLVSHKLDGPGEVNEDPSIAVSVHHLGAIPEGVVQPPRYVHARPNHHPVTVQRVSAEYPPIERIGVAGVSVSLVHGRISHWPTTLRQDQQTRKTPRRLVPGIVDLAVPTA